MSCRPGPVRPPATTRRAAALCLAASAAVAAFSAGPGTARAAAPCPATRCLTVTVPLDRTGALPGRLGLRVAVTDARRERRAPVIGLSGGPGQANRDFAEETALVLGSAVAGRDTVTFDGRGTGGSGLLRCPEFERRLEVSWATPAGSCGRSLGPRRELFTTADSVEDVEAVRARLGAGRVALYGVSYGTKVALDYARRYPRRVERVILDSPVEADGGDPFALATLAALPRVLRAVCRTGCGSPSPVADLRRLARALRSRPVRRVVEERGQRVPVTVTADDALGLLISSDLMPSLLRRVPGAVRAALDGRPVRLVRLERTARRLEDLGAPREFSPALFAATLCAEAPVAWDRAAPPATRRAQALAALDAVPDEAFAVFDRRAALTAGLLPLCVDWPAPARPLPAPGPVPDVPVLVLSGELDLRTPVETARRLAAGLPRAALVVQPGTGHSVLGVDPGDCASRATLAFLREATPPACGAG